MNTIKERISTLFMGVCTSLLALLGFGCSSDPGETPSMYGMPTGDFEIKGTVTDEAGAEVADAEIRVTHGRIPSGEYSLETTVTNASGQYFTEGESYGDSELKVVCLPSDPGLEADSVVVKLHYDKKNAGTWYVGSAKETVDFKLKFKDSEEK